MATAPAFEIVALLTREDAVGVLSPAVATLAPDRDARSAS